LIKLWLRAIYFIFVIVLWGQIELVESHMANNLVLTQGQNNDENQYKNRGNSTNDVTRLPRAPDEQWEVNFERQTA